MRARIIIIIRIKEGGTKFYQPSTNHFLYRVSSILIARKIGYIKTTEGEMSEKVGETTELPCQLLYEGVSLASIYCTFYLYLRRSFSLFLSLAFAVHPEFFSGFTHASYCCSCHGWRINDVVRHDVPTPRLSFFTGYLRVGASSVSD